MSKGKVGVFSQEKERIVAIDAKYGVSDLGVVYSDGLPLVAIGGVGVNLHGKRVKLAYLVARTFVPNAECRMFVRHKDGDVTNNRADNLEWCDEQESRKRGPKEKLRPVAKYSMEGEKLGVYSNVREAEKLGGVPACLIWNALSGRTRTAGGYLWRWL